MLDRTSPEDTNRVAIIGAGLMGMALARKLADAGHQVTVFEHAPEVGGLNTWHNYGSFCWDRFYHVILPSDTQLIGLVRELGMESDLQWNRTYTGFFVDDKLHSISSNLEFLRFPLLSFFSKIRLAWTMFYASRVNNWKPLEQLTVEAWLTRVSGKNNYEKLWKPLLLAKLGSSHTRVSAVFIWSYIKRMFSARDRSASAEHLGHVKGGYQSIFAKLRLAVEDKGGDIRTSQAVTSVSVTAENRLQISCDGQTTEFDKVVCTSPANVLAKLVDPSLLKVSKPSSEIEYLGVVCVVLVTKASLSPYYVINIADDSIPFTGVIGMSNVINPANTADHHLTFLPRYLLSTDSELEKSDEYFKESFVAGLQKMFPDFDNNDIIDVHVNRASKVQPLQVLDYSSKVPQTETMHPHLFVLNTSQFVNATLNNNEVIGAVNRFFDTNARHFISTSIAKTRSQPCT